MKFTKLLALVGAMAVLFVATGCKDVSGDGETKKATDPTTGEKVTVPAKNALQMTVDSTGDQIKAGDNAITDSNEETMTKVLAQTDEGKAAKKGHEAEVEWCGKRFFKEISAGLNNNCGFRTNLVIDVKNSVLNNPDTNRQVTIGVLFDFYKYEKGYDFFFLAFKPKFTGTDVSGLTCYFERYSDVKKYKDGIYTSDAAASALGSNFIQTAIGTWDKTLYAPDAGKTYAKSLSAGTDYIYDKENGTITIGIDAKQLSDGCYTVRVGKITYTLKDGTTTTNVSGFKQTSKTAFAATTTMGKGGAGVTFGVSDIADYTNWTFGTDTSKVTLKDAVAKAEKAGQTVAEYLTAEKKTLLRGGVMVYGFAPYGTKAVASYYTCATKASDETSAASAGENVDFVGDWKTAETLTGRSYQDGDVIYEFVKY